MNIITKNVIMPMWAKGYAATLSGLYLNEAKQEEYKLPEKEPFCILINDISYLKLIDFITATVKGDLRLLIMYGEPNENQLREAFNTIMSQYFERRKDKKIERYVKLQREMTDIATHLQRIELLVSALVQHCDERIAERIRSMGYQLPLKQETLPNDIKRIETLVKAKVTQYNRLKGEYEATFKKSEDKDGKGVYTKEYWIKTISTVYDTDTPLKLANDITVEEYCIRYDEYVEKVEAEKLANKTKNINHGRQ